MADHQRGRSAELLELSEWGRWALREQAEQARREQAARRALERVSSAWRAQEERERAEQARKGEAGPEGPKVPEPDIPLDPRKPLQQLVAAAGTPLGSVDDPPSGEGLGVTHTALQGTGHEMKFVGLTGGEFSMGCENEGDKQCYDGEKPRHRVRLGPFQIGQTEVTQGQWVEVMGEAPNPSSHKGDDHLPV